ncbi:hypothetical protein IT411_02535 [Candidatus Peregrinibacteria bacterium]|nr:hypothetical protein [Candidatus Peregrinibacteria bacterium]
MKRPSEKPPTSNFGGIITRTVSGLSLERLSMDKRGEFDIETKVDLANLMYGTVLQDVISILKDYGDINELEADCLYPYFLVQLIHLDFINNPDSVSEAIVDTLEFAFQDRAAELALIMHKIDELLQENRGEAQDKDGKIQILSVQALIKKLVDALAS